MGGKAIVFHIFNKCLLTLSPIAICEWAMKVQYYDHNQKPIWASIINRPLGPECHQNNINDFEHI
eukprot:UN16181